MVSRILILSAVAFAIGITAQTSHVGYSTDRSTKKSTDRSTKKMNEYIKIEVKGKLKDGVVAIGGETTGTTITSKGVTFEIDIGKRKRLIDVVKKLNGKTVLVIGALERRRGIEMPDRWIITVSVLKHAGVKR